MIFKRFSLHIIARTSLLAVTVSVFVYLLNIAGYHTSSVLLAILSIIQYRELVRYVEKTNQELTRFLDAARHADYSQQFNLDSVGLGFKELGAAFSEILHRLQQSSQQKEQALRHIKAIIEHVPAPLISIKPNQQLTLWNTSARRLFGSNHVTELSDLRQFGIEQPEQLMKIAAGERQLIEMQIDGMAYTLSLMATKIYVAQQQETLLSMQDIQSELDIAQLQAWQELVKVLTHEIMNSITPVASLAKTTVDLVADIQHKGLSPQQAQDELADIANAVNTVARRSDGLIHFVNHYRRLTHIPTPNKKVIKVKELIDRAVTLFTQQWSEKNIHLEYKVTPVQLDISVDCDLIEQVLINLLQNAEHALAGQSIKQIAIKARLNKRGRVVIEIADNGQGIAEQLLTKIFVPFYTTKKEGSGVGLALTRQIMSAHGGLISVRNNTPHGAVFSLVF